MRAGPSLFPSASALVDHTSAEGPTITHVRGMMMVNSVSNMKSVGLWEQYLARMPKAYAECLQQSVATDWLPVDVAVAHYRVADELSVQPEKLAQFGERQAQRITETFLGMTLKRVRSVGVDAYKPALKQIDRLHDRLYRGGGCAVLDVGPKDIVLEINGFPFAESRAFRAAWLRYVETIGATFCKVVYAKLVRPRTPHPHNLAVLVSWV